MALHRPVGADRDGHPLSRVADSIEAAASTGGPLRDPRILEILRRASVFPSPRTVSLDLSARALR